MTAHLLAVSEYPRSDHPSDWTSRTCPWPRRLPSIYASFNNTSSRLLSNLCSMLYESSDAHISALECPRASWRYDIVPRLTLERVNTNSPHRRPLRHSSSILLGTPRSSRGRCGLTWRPVLRHYQRRVGEQANGQDIHHLMGTDPLSYRRQLGTPEYTRSNDSLIRLDVRGLLPYSIYRKLQHRRKSTGMSDPTTLDGCHKAK